MDFDSECVYIYIYIFIPSYDMCFWARSNGIHRNTLVLYVPHWDDGTLGVFATLAATWEIHLPGCGNVFYSSVRGISTLKFFSIASICPTAFLTEMGTSVTDHIEANVSSEKHIYAGNSKHTNFRIDPNMVLHTHSKQYVNANLYCWEYSIFVILVLVWIFPR